MTGHSALRKWLLIVVVSLALPILIVADSACKPKPYVRRTVPLHPEARETLTAFQVALKDHAWEEALTLCSDAVKAAAQGYDSPAEFFRDVVPMEQIISLPRFEIRAKRYEGGRRLEVLAYGWKVPVALDPEGWPVSQTYEITNDGGRWEITLPCEPLETWVEDIRQRREKTQGQLAEVAKALMRQAAEERGEAAPSDAFLAENQKEGHALKQRRDEERREKRLLREERLATLMPRIKGVGVALKAANNSCRMSEPVLLTLELVSNADSALYYRFGTTGRSLTVLDDRGRIVACKSPDHATNVAVARIEPGQRVVLSEGYDIAATHVVDRPGRYRVEFNGHMLSVGDKFGADPNADPLYAPIDLISDMVQIEVLR